MTNEDKKMIPLSVINALIAELEILNQSGDFNDTINQLEAIKKEAIPSPEPVGKKELEWMDKIPERGLEQKIKARIKELKHDLDIWNKQAAEEAHNGFYFSAGDMAREAEYVEKQIDELRKLLK